MKPKLLSSTVLAVLAFACAALAQDQQYTEAEKISKGLTEAYTDAFNKGDAKALAAMYAEDAQYTSDAGNVVVGQAAMLEKLAKYFARNMGARLEVQVKSARFLTPDVLLEKGFATIDDETTRYVCSYEKKDG